MRISDWSSDVCSSDLASSGMEYLLIDAARPDADIIAHPLFTQHLRHALGRGDDGVETAIETTQQGFDHRLQKSEPIIRSEEHTSELQSLMRISYAVFCLKKTKITT